MIKYPRRFNQAQPANYDGLFDWDFLEPAFAGTLIMPMDIDAVVERRGKVLIFETKDVGVDIPLGQKITLETLLRIGRGSIYLMIIYGKTPNTIEGLDEWGCGYKGGGIVYKGYQECDADFVLKRVSAWFAWANSRS